MMLAAYQPQLATVAAGLVPVDADQANASLTAWGHYLGACARPFRVVGWVLTEHQDAAEVAVHTSHGWVLLDDNGGWEVLP